MADAPGSFADTLRDAIADRGLGLERIHAHLDRRGTTVSVATLSYWQSGRSQPQRRMSLDALPHLEEILGLDPGRLLATLPSSRDRARRAEVMALDAVWPEPPRTRVLQRLDTRWDEELDRLSLHEVLVIGRDRRQETLTVRQVLRSRADGPDRRVVLHCHDDPDAQLPTIVPLQGCRLGPVHTDRAGVVGAELVFPRALRRGETQLLDYRLDSGDPAPFEHECQRRLRLRMRVYVLEVQFHPDATPASCESFSDDEARQLQLDADHRVHLVDTDCTASSTGIRWTWPTALEPPGATRDRTRDEALS
jgi:hypothetical protein